MNAEDNKVKIDLSHRSGGDKNGAEGQEMEMQEK